MKDFLETLEIGESKEKLSQEDIKKILAKNGEIVNNETTKVENKYKTDIESYKTTISDLKKQIEEAPKSDEMESLKNQIAKYEEKETERIATEKAKAEDEILTNNIIEAIGDKKFVNDYTKNSIINEVKTALKDEQNMGKSAKDLFEQITNGKNGIFENPNKLVNMTEFDENIDTAVSKEDFEKMGYQQRLELKQTNPELFNKYNK